MARHVAEIKVTETDAAMIAFSPDAPFLAAGSQAGVGGIPWLCILRTAPGLLPGDPNLLDFPVACLDGSPASFSRLSCSKPAMTLSSSFPAGLLAGGLESGEVAVWDPREALRDMTCVDPDEKSFAENLQEGRWISRDFTIYEDYFAADKVWGPPAPTPIFEDTSGNTIAAARSGPVDKENGPVALFAKHTGPVGGLAFSPQKPTLLGSAAGHGQVMVFDLSKVAAETVPTWKAHASDGLDISFLSWSPKLPNILGTTSHTGVRLWDISSRSAIKEGHFPRRCSSLQFSPVDQNMLVVSTEDYSDLPALSVWDIRSMDAPVTEYCENTKGVTAMDWSSENTDVLLVSTKTDHLILWNIATQEVIWSEEMLERCQSVAWSPSSRGRFAAASSKHLSLFSLN